MNGSVEISIGKQWDTARDVIGSLLGIRSRAANVRLLAYALLAGQLGKAATVIRRPDANEQDLISLRWVIWSERPVPRRSLGIARCSLPETAGFPFLQVSDFNRVKLTCREPTADRQLSRKQRANRQALVEHPADDLVWCAARLPPRPRVHPPLGAKPRSRSGSSAL